MTQTPGPSSAAKKPYHAPDLRDYGTVKDLTLTGGSNLLSIDNPSPPDYATGNDA